MLRRVPNYTPVRLPLPVVALLKTVVNRLQFLPPVMSVKKAHPPWVRSLFVNVLYRPPLAPAFPSLTTYVSSHRRAHASVLGRNWGAFLESTTIEPESKTKNNLHPPRELPLTSVVLVCR